MGGHALHELDDDAVRTMAFRVWGYKQGEQVSRLIHLGDRLGLFRALAGGDPLHGTLEQNRANPMLAMMLGFSITSCMSSATSEPGGMGLGTVGLPASRHRTLAEAAGFTRFAPHDPGEPANANVCYELRP